MNAIHHRAKSSGGKRPTNISLDIAMLADAKDHGINISQACEAGLAMELKAVRDAKWKAENKATMQQWNDWIAKNGIPLSEHRQF